MVTLTLTILYEGPILADDAKRYMILNHQAFDRCTSSFASHILFFIKLDALSNAQSWDVIAELLMNTFRHSSVRIHGPKKL